MRDTPTEANRSLAVLRKFLSLACVEWELRDDNPAKSIKLFAETKRERVLSDDELKRLSETITGCSWPVRCRKAPPTVCGFSP